MLQVEPLYTNNKPAATVVRVRGEIDLVSAEQFRAVLLAAVAGGAPRVIVSLKDCAYFDSSGLAVLIGMHKLIGARLVIVLPARGAVARIFDVTGLADVLNIVSSISAVVDPLMLPSPSAPAQHIASA